MKILKRAETAVAETGKAVKTSVIVSAVALVVAVVALLVVIISG